MMKTTLDLDDALLVRAKAIAAQERTSLTRLIGPLTPDVNVLVAASRSDHPHHAAARAWLQNVLAGASTGSAIKLQPMVIAGFLRR